MKLKFATSKNGQTNPESGNKHAPHLLTFSVAKQTNLSFPGICSDQTLCLFSLIFMALILTTEKRFPFSFCIVFSTIRRK